MPESACFLKVLLHLPATHLTSLFYLFDKVRVEGGMSLRNGMWHGLRNDIIMWNVIYAE